MERNFTNENFERFLRQNSESLRMRPSTQVWKGISRHLNRRRRITGLILSVSLLAVSALGYHWFDHSAKPAGRTIIQNPNRTFDNHAPAQMNEPAGSSTIGVNQPKRIAENVPADLLSRIRKENELNLPTAVASPTVTTLNQFTSTVVDSYEMAEESTSSPASTQIQSSDQLTIESVINSYNRKRNKLSLQIYFTPTVSYRKLSENKPYLNSNNSLSYLNDINSVVTHKPDFGFEMGVAAKYPVSKNVKLRGGLQFNVNRYDIKAFSSPLQLATITLNDRNGSTDQVNAITNYTNYNNSVGYRANWLENFYFQVSSPVGMELKLRGDDKMQFGIATTIQPTYVLGDRAYLISTDYKNYAEVPWLIRRWNVNTNLETFVSYSTGHLKWQVGPQVRYQLLSSFVKKYPVKENLFDFGLKVGIALNNNQ